jgi:hypothetical protein
MRIIHVSAAILGLFVIAVQADEFYLQHDATGKVYGPFQTDAGAKVAIGTTAFTVVKKTASASSVDATLDGIIIPQVELRQAALQDAVDFLKMQIQALDPKRTGVNFVIAKSPSTTRTKPSTDPFAPPGPGGDSDMGPMVTLSLKNVTALQVLKSMMDQTGYTYRTSGNTITIVAKK